MLDTTTIVHHISPTPDQLRQWIKLQITFPNGRNLPKYFQNISIDNGAVLSFVHYPPNPPLYQSPWLSVQASLPAVLFGNNIELITKDSEIEDAINQINRFTSTLSWLPKFDFGGGSPWRLDAVYDHHVGPYGPDYVRRLFKLDYPQRKTRPYPHEGVQFKSEVATTKFYDKEKESRSLMALGILRQESTLRHTYYIERRLGLQDPTLRDVKCHLLLEILHEDLECLRLYNCTFVDSSKAQQVLIGTYGYGLGNTLFGHLLNRQNRTKEQIIAQGANSNTLRKYERQIADAGVSLALTDDQLLLPPLGISLPYDIYIPSVVSDTRTSSHSIKVGRKYDGS